MEWQVYFTRKAAKQAKKLPKTVLAALQLLVEGNLTIQRMVFEVVNVQICVKVGRKFDEESAMYTRYLSIFEEDLRPRLTKYGHSFQWLKSYSPRMFVVGR